MNAAAAGSEPSDGEPVLIFQWGRRTRAHWRLGLMILLSLFAHAASFYVLQVAYTPTGSLLPPPARVVLVPLDQPENAALARWLALADPTLATQSFVPPTEDVLDSLGLKYVPSYDALPPGFKPLDPVVSTESISAPPRPQELGPVSVAETAAGSTASRTGQPTMSSCVKFSGEIGALVPGPLPPVRFAENSGAKPVEPTVFLVGVRAEGGAPFLFPVRQAALASAGTGADEVNELARAYLARLQFQPSNAPDGGVTWGRATFYWGNDAPTTAK